MSSSCSSVSSPTVLIAVAEIGSAPTFNPDANFSKLRRFAAEAKQRDVKILVTPELFVTGYKVKREDLQANAMPPSEAGNAFVDMTKQIATEIGIDIITGFTSKTGNTKEADNRVLNTIIWVSAEGQLLRVYHKSHLWGAEEKKTFTTQAGADLQQPILRFGLNFGLLICYEIEFPEPARVLALRNADCLLVPTACKGLGQAKMIPVRAGENGFFVACANHPMPRFAGLSGVFGPDMETVSREVLRITSSYSDDEGQKYEEDVLLISAVGKRRVVGEDDYLNDRRSEMYHDLVKTK